MVENMFKIPSCGTSFCSKPPRFAELWGFRFGLLAAFMILVAGTPALLLGEAERTYPSGGPPADHVSRLEVLPAGPGNPRNSEGDFIRLKDGRLLFVYSHFTGNGQDDSAAHLAARYSTDDGRTWTDHDELVVQNEGAQNVMSVSLLRLADGRIALFYGRRESLTDGRPVLRLSSDEGRTWGPPTLCITDEVAGYNLNNARAIQLKTGRIVLPVARHTLPGQPTIEWPGTLMAYFSDDNGSWNDSHRCRQHEAQRRRNC
jgi:hypothetical protein